MKHRELLKRVGIKWRIFGSFAIFTLLILVILWIFQVVFLNDFYKFIKTNEIKNTAQTLVSSVDSDDFPTVLENTWRNSQINILVSDDQGRILYQIPTSTFGGIDSKILSQVYQVAELQGGSYLERATRLGMEDAQRPGHRAEPETILFARTAVKSDGTKVLVLLHSVITPVDATVNTLRVQLICVSAIMLVLALLLALVLSKHISRPIIQINQTARRLADGDYSVKFEENGYREVSELGHTMNYAASELSKTETLRRDLIANVSHDLRTPLTMITGYSEVMRDLPGENTPENVQIIIDESTRLTSLVNDMLDLSKFQSGTQTYHREKFSLTESIHTILLRYSKLTDYNITFTADHDVIVCGDELKISQVFYNLVNNAITYTGADKVVDIHQTVQNGRVRVEVRDTGEGIPQEKLHDIWDRYYKVDKEHKRAQIGTGLGLSIVKTILDMHGGAYGVKSQEGVGSVFWFELDVVQTDHLSGQ